MSISNEIQRIQNAKEAIKTSINNKGGSLTDTSKLDEFATAIDNLPSGGSGEQVINGFTRFLISDLKGYEQFAFFDSGSNYSMITENFNIMINKIREVFTAIENEGAKFYVYTIDVDLSTSSFITRYVETPVANLNIIVGCLHHIVSYGSGNAGELDTSDHNIRNNIYVGIDHIITPLAWRAIEPLSEREKLLIIYDLLEQIPSFIIKYSTPFTPHFNEQIPFDTGTFSMYINVAPLGNVNYFNYTVLTSNICEISWVA